MQTAFVPTHGQAANLRWHLRDVRTSLAVFDLGTGENQRAVPPTGFGPAFSSLRGKRPRPLDHGGLERMTRVELATSYLASTCSTY